jgi:hypothetical protein
MPSCVLILRTSRSGGDHTPSAEMDPADLIDRVRIFTLRQRVLQRCRAVSNRTCCCGPTTVLPKNNTGLTGPACPQRNWDAREIRTCASGDLLSSFRRFEICCVPVNKFSRLRSSLAHFAQRETVSLKGATHSDLEAPISSVPFSVPGPCPRAV